MRVDFGVGSLLNKIDRHATGSLVVAAVLVGVAIVLNGAAAKAVNGIAGCLWIAVAGVLLNRSRCTKRWRPIAFALVIAFLLVNVAKPSDLELAVLGFALGGGLLAIAAGVEDARELVLLPALWLPVHLLTAGIRATMRALRDLPAHVRTEPPPTAALVPLAMVVAAYVGGIAVIAWRDRGRHGSAARKLTRET